MDVLDVKMNGLCILTDGWIFVNSEVMQFLLNKTNYSLSNLLLLVKLFQESLLLKSTQQCSLNKII